MATKNSIFARYVMEYLGASTKRKGEILNCVCDVTALHRKAAIRKFRAMQMNGDQRTPRRGRPVYYTTDVTAALKTVWEAASGLCGELIYPIITEYVTILQRDNLWPHSTPATTKLLQMREATVKRRVSVFMCSGIHQKGFSTTSPSTLKQIIPIFTGPWSDKPPGFGQIDTVVHCGASLLGDMAFSVNYTDINTGWVSFMGQWNKGQQATRDSLVRITEKVPFIVLGMHPDTGSEFINWYLKGWCDEVGIELTRSRPNHKNDNAYVEQKNGHVIRRFLGYTRLGSPDVIPLMNTLYDTLEIYLNHFVPSRKCLEKVRVGSKYHRRYDHAQTAYQRVLAHPAITKEVKEKLQIEHATLNPLILRRRVATLTDELFTRNRALRQSEVETVQ